MMFIYYPVKSDWFSFKIITKKNNNKIAELTVQLG